MKSKKIYLGLELKEELKENIKIEIEEIEFDFKEADFESDGPDEDPDVNIFAECPALGKLRIGIDSETLKEILRKFDRFMEETKKEAE